jgi:hypothetical protein
MSPPHLPLRGFRPRSAWGVRPPLDQVADLTRRGWSRCRPLWSTVGMRTSPLGPASARRQGVRAGARPRGEPVPKYVDVLFSAFQQELLFPAEFVGRGDMSRRGLMLRALDAQRELAYVPVRGAILRGGRPPQLPPRSITQARWLADQNRGQVACFRYILPGLSSQCWGYLGAKTGMSGPVNAFKSWVLNHGAQRNPLDESGVMLLGGGFLLAGICYYYLYRYMPLMRIGGYDPWWLVGAVICWIMTVYLLILMLRELWHLTICRLQEFLDEGRRLLSSDANKQLWFNALLAIAFAVFLYFENGAINGLTLGGWPAWIANVIVTIMLMLAVAMPAFLAATAKWVAK